MFWLLLFVAAASVLIALWERIPTDIVDTLYLGCLSFCALGYASSGLDRAFWTAYVATMVYGLWHTFRTVWKMSRV